MLEHPPCGKPTPAVLTGVPPFVVGSGEPEGEAEPEAGGVEEPPEVAGAGGRTESLVLPAMNPST